VAAPKTIGLALDKLQEKDVSFAFSNVLESGPFKSLTVGLKSAYVIGRTTIGGGRAGALTPESLDV